MMTVRWLDEDRWDEWDAFATSCEEGSVFHTSSWLTLLQTVFAHIRGRVAVVLRGRTIEAGLAACEVRSRLLGKRYVSVPFASVTDPPPASAEHFDILLDFLEEERRRNEFHSLEIRSCRRCLPGLREGGTANRSYRHHFIELTNLDEESLFSGCSRTCVRQRVSRAQRAGVVIRPADDPTDWGKFYRLHEDLRRRLRMPVMPRAFFDALRDKSGSPQTTLLLAELHGEPLSAGLALHDRQRCLLDWVGNAQGSRDLGADQLLYWSMMQRALRNGATEFSLGRTGPCRPCTCGTCPHKGLCNYKRHWGCAEEQIVEFLLGDRTGFASTKDSLVAQALVHGVMRCAPRRLYQSISAVCYRHLG